jgi:ParB-like chromosome segregation protein Spo0J
MSKPKPSAETVSGVVRIADPVPLATIFVVEGFNARTTFAEKPIATLAESMAAVGQLEDIILAPRLGADGQRAGWNLVAGARRVKAAQLLGWPSLRASEVPPAAAADVMGAENADRVDLPHADRVRYIVAQLAGRANAGFDDATRATFADVATLARRFRLSASAVRNDNLIGTKLDPDVFAEWARFPHAAGIALRLYARPAEQQRAMFAEWQAAREAEETTRKAAGGKRTRAKRGGKGGDAEPSRRPIGEVRAAIGEMVEQLKAAKGNTARDSLDKEVAAFVAGAEWALAFMFTDGKGIPGDVRAELKRAAKAAPVDKRQLALPGTKGKGGK